MPELPDVTVYVERLAERIAGARLERVELASPFVLRSVEPPLERAAGRSVAGVGRLGKRIVVSLDGELHLVVHLMIAGRLAWRDARAKPSKARGLARFEFETGTLTLTEAGTRRRASLHLVSGAAALAAHDRGGLDPLTAPTAQIADALRRERHTLKRALTDQRILAGIGNSYSDEILHAARLSPFRHTTALDDPEMDALVGAVREVLTAWTERLRAESAGRFPTRVTAFRDGMAVHGRFGEPCPECGAPVQRVLHADSAFNYCAGCQTDGRILADRSLSRLLKESWPRRLEDLE